MQLEIGHVTNPATLDRDDIVEWMATHTPDRSPEELTSFLENVEFDFEEQAQNGTLVYRYEDNEKVVTVEFSENEYHPGRSEIFIKFDYQDYGFGSF